MSTILDLHLPADQNLQVVMASPKAVVVFNDVNRLPHELSFGLEEKCEVSPIDQAKDIFCVTTVDDNAVIGVFNLIQAVFAKKLKKMRLTEAPAFFVSPNGDGGMHIVMMASPAGRKTQYFDCEMPDEFSINNCCVSMRWEIGHIEVPITAPEKADHVTLQKTEALWDKICSASETAMEKIADETPAISVEIVK